MSEHRHPRCIAPVGAVASVPHMIDLEIANRLHKELTAALADGKAKDARIADLERKLEAVMCWGLVLFADGELDEERANAFRSHLERCADCRESLRANNAITAVVSEAASPRQPEEV